MKRKIGFIILMFSMVMFFSSCNKAPQEQYDSLNTALNAALEQGADKYLPDMFNTLMDSMDVVAIEMDAKKGKLFANYSEQVEKLEGLLVCTDSLVVKLEVRKTEVKTEVETMLVEMESMMETADALVSKAPRGKEGTLAVEAIKNELTTITQSVSESVTLSENGDHISALDKLKVSKARLTSIVAELEGVISKYQR